MLPEAVGTGLIARGTGLLDEKGLAMHCGGSGWEAWPMWERLRVGGRVNGAEFLLWGCGGLLGCPEPAFLSNEGKEGMFPQA